MPCRRWTVCVDGKRRSGVIVPMENVERRPGESDLSYHRRLVYGKLIDGTLVDLDYAELAPLVYDREYSTDVARRMMYGSCKTLQLMDQEGERGWTQDERIQELEDKKLELQKERQKFFDQRSAFNKAVRERARQEELNEIIRKAVEGGELPELRSEPRYVEPSGCDMLVSLNDIHYGANVDNYWTKYNSDVCRGMMRGYLDRILEIQRVHGCENCVVWANGDLISGNIHRSIAVTNKENVVEQVTGVSELIAQFLVELSERFATVRFVSVAGNHSRIDKKDDALKDERLDDFVEWYLEARLQNFPNIVFGAYEKIDSTMYLMDVRGKLYCGVHGDYDCTPQQVQSLQTMARRPVYAILTGHKHHNETNTVQGVKTVMAGTFLGMDDLCVTRRIYSEAEQMVCVCDENGILCYYDILLKERG